MTLRRCRACGFIFQPEASRVLADRALLDGLYAEYVATVPLHLRLNSARVEKLKKIAGGSLAGKRVLEIGPGTGALGHLIAGAGADYRAVEPFGVCYEAAVAAFPELRPLIHRGPFGTAGFAEDSFDLVVMTDTLEHIPEPREFLSGLIRFIGPSGRLYVEVPNESIFPLKAFVRRLFGMYGRGYPTNPEHRSLFTPRTLALLLKRCGYHALGVEEDSVWGDPTRMRIAFGGRPPLAVTLGSWFFRLTKLDLALGQGVIAATAVPGQGP